MTTNTNDDGQGHRKRHGLERSQAGAQPVALEGQQSASATTPYGGEGYSAITSSKKHVTTFRRKVRGDVSRLDRLGSSAPWPPAKTPLPVARWLETIPPSHRRTCHRSPKCRNGAAWRHRQPLLRCEPQAKPQSLLNSKTMNMASEERGIYK